MADKITREQRSNNMSRIRSGNTQPEIIVRKLLHRMGYRFRIHRDDLPGKPDIVLPKYRTVVFVHGCFWHSHPGCKRAVMPKSNIDYWHPKIERNKQRDLDNTKKLVSLGWNVCIIWECETKDRLYLQDKLLTMLQKRI